MIALRRLFRRKHRIVLPLILAVLAMKLLVPAGFMPVVAGDGTVTVRICTGTGAVTMEMAIPGMPPTDHKAPAPAKAEMPCAFAGLAMPAVRGADPLLLAPAVAFAMALAMALVTLLPFRGPPRLRPPLRAPPITA